MRVGVVGHRGYRDLPDVLRTLTTVAPKLDISLHFEEELREVAGSSSPLASLSTHTRSWSRPSDS